jgi:hypothetical protein
MQIDEYAPIYEKFLDDQFRKNIKTIKNNYGEHTKLVKQIYRGYPDNYVNYFRYYLTKFIVVCRSFKLYDYIKTLIF